MSAPDSKADATPDGARGPLRCPQCSAPLPLELGQVECSCGFCGSHLRFVPGRDELAVVRAREEVKARERVALEQARLKQELEAQEAERWRQTAARVAIAALPIVGRTAGRAVFDAALHRAPRGCLGCGCLLLLSLAGAGTALAAVCWW